jgi:hypothetical protein
MGYTVSRAVIQRNLEQLEQLLKLKTTLVFKGVSNPQKLAYKLREAINAAKAFEEYQHLAELEFLYKFRVGPNELVAQFELLDSSPEKPGSNSDEKIPAKPKPPEKKTIPDASTLLDLLGFALKFPNEHEILFPHVDLTSEDKLKLYEWTRGEGITWRFIDHEEAGVTLTKRDVPKEVLWKPT